MESRHVWLQSKVWNLYLSDKGDNGVFSVGNEIILYQCNVCPDLTPDTCPATKSAVPVCLADEAIPDNDIEKIGSDNITQAHSSPPESDRQVELNIVSGQVKIKAACLKKWTGSH